MSHITGISEVKRMQRAPSKPKTKFIVLNPSTKWAFVASRKSKFDAKDKNTSSLATSKKEIFMKRAKLATESYMQHQEQGPPNKKKRIEVEIQIDSKEYERVLFNRTDRTTDHGAKVQEGTLGLTMYGENDVLFGRGGGTNAHLGNCRFRNLIHAHRRAYMKAKKNDKPVINRFIVRSIREANGRFLKINEHDGLWYEVGDNGAREKTSQALRQKAPGMRNVTFKGKEIQLGFHDDSRQTVINQQVQAPFSQKLFMQYNHQKLLTKNLKSQKCTETPPYNSKGFMLHSGLSDVHPDGSSMQGNAQAWITQTLLNKGINMFTPREA